MGHGPEGKDRFPFGKKRRNDEIEFHRGATAAGRLKEEAGYVHAVYDSPLERDFNSGSSFEGTFLYVLPPGSGGLRSYIEESLEDKKGNAIGIEFGGPGSRLFSGFSRGFFEKTLGVALADVRGRLSPGQIAADEKRHHSILEGDITVAQTYNDVREWLDGRKADLIIERLEGGRLYIPEDPYLIGEMLNNWYNILSENGILLAQTSAWMHPLIVSWKKLIDEKYENTLDFGYVHDPLGLDVYDAIRLRRFHGAPEKLPMLDIRMVREISKKNAGRGV